MPTPRFLPVNCVMSNHKLWRPALTYTPQVVVSLDQLRDAPPSDREGYVVVDVESDDEDDDECCDMSRSAGWLGYDMSCASVQDAKHRYHLAKQTGGRYGNSRSTYYSRKKERNDRHKGIACCARAVLSREPDFVEQKEWLEETVEDELGFKIIFFSKLSL